MAGEVSFRNMGSSIPVDNVQALAASIYDQDSTSVPPRYLRPEAKTTDPIASDGENSSLRSLISLDLSIAVPHKKSLPSFTTPLQAWASSSCWCIPQLINHGVPDEVIEKLKADIIDFFNLPLEEKKAVAQLPNDLQGYGQAFVVSEDQKLDWGDMLFLMTRPLHIRNMRFWPTRPPTFRDTLSSYSVELKRVAATLLELIAKCLGIVPEELLDIFEEIPQGLRINYYPPCPKADEVVGLSPHSDATAGLTLLLHVNDVPGLQIKHQGKWFLVDPLPGAFLVNVGDMLEILSNGEYKSIEHRAIVNTKRERLSVAAFHFPKEDAVIGPLPGLVKGGKGKYKSEDFRKLLGILQFQTRGEESCDAS
ncbi:S-norcoclaurine synthase 1-like [Canna indica]|uniref:S-norcoclaurine synthase 1-like n=1 Tax=Canna indica TaxID=4628 RepID=A0AAQ3Q8C5_9LILI|nr:S-norcoclaurine synthase 1-like [Canna indica]